jgi:hypothetical protein
VSRYIVSRCDESDGGHTWDIWQGDRVVHQGFATRERARAEAAKLNALVARFAVVETLHPSVPGRRRKAVLLTTETLEEALGACEEYRRDAMAYWTDGDPLVSSFDVVEGGAYICTDCGEEHGIPREVDGRLYCRMCAPR